jgi:sulfite reductase alpha subunit-like flavoprotein
MDYIYQEELENAVKDGVLSKVYTSFSRAPDQPKVRR